MTLTGDGRRSFELDERESRIVATAVELAEEGGFEAVRLRDVAANSGVALGTLYRHFRSKEDLLVAALAVETDGLQRSAVAQTPPGETPLARAVSHLRGATRALCRRPKFARAMLRAAASGEPELTEKMELFHVALGTMIVAALRGVALGELDASPATELEAEIADLLQHVWFAALVGWAGGLHGEEDVVERVERAGELLLRGAGLQA